MFVYHITHLKNLPKILAAGGLCCDRIRDEQKVECVGIAHQHIKDRRKKRLVRSLSGQIVAQGGTLWDYVPFYFAPRSPMLYTINQGKVEGYSEGQMPIVHLVTSVEQLQKSGRSFAFTNGHGDMSLTDFSDDLSRIPQFVDLSIMQSTYWNDTVANPDRKRRRQAEFLLHEFVPWKLIEKIGVIDGKTKLNVEAAMQTSSHKPLVVVERGWYY